MHPTLLVTPWFSVHSYGVFLALAFLIGAAFMARGLARQGLDVSVVPLVLLVGVGTGLFGGRLFSALDHPDFLARPAATFFLRAGLAYLGGFLCATLAIAFVLRRHAVPFVSAADAVAPGLAFGYASARVGCLLAGDGCYGAPTLWSWGMQFPQGLAPTLASNGALRARFEALFPGTPVPDVIAVHPTPIYEALISIAIGIVLLRLGREVRPPGLPFATSMALMGTERFLIEFVRLNPSLAFGLSQAQLISLGLLACSLCVHLFYALPPRSLAGARS